MIPFGPTVHVLKVTLRDVKPAVWRRIVVHSETPLPRFAQTLVAAMGWGGYHLHVFDVCGVQFGPPDDDFDLTIDERYAKVQHVLPVVKSKLRWDYDLGDGWEHDVVVEAIEASPEGTRVPTCLAGRRACPPEDCGGPGGYQALLRALADPAHPEHEHARSWVPDGFDPAAFDLQATNRRLR